MPLNELEKSRIRRALGYPEVQPMGSIALGIPQPLQTSFLIEVNMTTIMEIAIPRVRSVLEILDNIEAQMVDAQDYLVAAAVGDITLRGGGGTGKGSTDRRNTTDLLETEYVRWAKRLAEMFGVPVYPYADRFRNAASGTGMIPVAR